MRNPFNFKFNPDPLGIGDDNLRRILHVERRSAMAAAFCIGIILGLYVGSEYGQAMGAVDLALARAAGEDAFAAFMAAALPDSHPAVAQFTLLANLIKTLAVAAVIGMTLAICIDIVALRRYRRRKGLV